MDVCNYVYGKQREQTPVSRYTATANYVSVPPELLQTKQVVFGPFRVEVLSSAIGLKSYIHFKTDRNTDSVPDAGNMTYVDVLSDVSSPVYQNVAKRTASVSDRLLFNESFSRTNASNFSGALSDCGHVDNSVCDGVNSKGSSPDVVTSNTVKSVGKRSLLTTAFWAGTPWNDFSAFKDDVFNKCAQFFHRYIWRWSNNNMQHKNNSKSQKGGTTSTSVPSMKRPRQPDVVNNTLKKTNSLDEITRLEALCESRTKELNKVKILLRKRTTGFEAMIAIVKYLTDELNAFSCPMITAQLAEAQEQVKKSVLQLEELTKQRDAVIDEIQSIKQQHAEETESLIAKHQQALLALTDKLVKEKEDAVNEVIEKHSHEVNALKSYQERTMREIEEKHEKSIAEKKKQYEEELTRLKREHEKQINDLHCDHESKLNEITMRFETIKLNLLDKVEKLRIEGEELRQREAAMTEKCQRESDYKIQCALAHYKKEVESLNTVLELRASECHQLRKQVLEMQKELEKLPVAQEKIKSQEQQIENLQAIIDLRADNERSLTQKHNVLLRKYDKETKVTKRLSLDREELMWRLQEYDASGGVRRSISHSPTGSETSTPETIRRHRSPLPHSPHSPCDPKRSPLQKVPPQGSLKRTGTYEVLPQEYDDMNNLKQSDL